MRIPILIEVTDDHRFRATGREPFATVVEVDERYGSYHPRAAGPLLIY